MNLIIDIIMLGRSQDLVKSGSSAGLCVVATSHMQQKMLPAGAVAARAGLLLGQLKVERLRSLILASARRYWIIWINFLSLSTSLRIFIGVILTMTSLTGAFAENRSLQIGLEALEAESGGRLGVCVLANMDREPICVRANEPFPLQSVMKLIVGAVVMDAVDRQELKLNDGIRVSSGDTSPGPDEFANFVKSRGTYEATVEELLRRSIVDSDSTSVDVLIARLGGIPAIQDFLKRKRISGVRIDRNERQLQTESLGLSWQPEYADLGRFEAAAQALPLAERDRSWEAHLSDPRDKATPMGMVMFLRALVAGELLSDSSTEKLLNVMAETATGKDRFPAGLPPGWRVAHKTGTGRTWKGVTEATNDVGILTAPDGGKVIAAAFLAESNACGEKRAAVIASVARSVASHFYR